MSDENDFSNKIKALAGQSETVISKRSNERATDNWVIQPLINALGYDTFNPNEVEPEYTADVGVKRDEKVDYALKIKGQPVIIVEIKAAKESLRDQHHSQLFRYFSALPDVRIAILANGKEAWFYADLDRRNVMDAEPFFKFSFQNNNEDDMAFLQLFRKDQFSVDKIVSTANAHKNFDKVKEFIQSDIINPNENFVKFIGKAVMGHAPRKNEFAGFQRSIKSAFDEILQKSDGGENSISPSPKPAANPSITNSLTSAEQANMSYFAGLLNFLRETNSSLQNIPKAPARWNGMRFGIGKPPFNLCPITNGQSKRISVELHVNKDLEKILFDKLITYKDEVERDIGVELQWLRNNGVERGKIVLEKNADVKDKSDFQNQYAWFKDTLEKFDKAFRDRIQRL